MRIVYLPLDSRPCNLVFPQQFISWCGGECVVPPANEMDHFTVPASFQAAQAFLARETPAADALVLSLDRLCYGSLLASREIAVSPQEAQARLAWLRGFLAQYPSVPVYAFSVVIRSSISALSLGDLDAYRAMTDYSVYSGRFAALGDPEDAARAEEAKGRIPPKILETYHAVRRRNHEINRQAVAMARERAFESLLLLMEDSQEYGFHRMEQQALLALMDGDSRAVLHNGTDEGGALAAARAMLSGRRVSAQVRWLGHPDGNFIALYEDRPFRENVRSALAYAGVDVREDSPYVLAIAAPADGAQKEAPSLPPRKDALQIADAVSDLMDQGKRVYLLDVIGANGGCAQMMEALRGPERLWGYSAWNTASNSLGTAIAQLACDQLAGRPNLAHRDERILDDLIYESILRQRLNRILMERGEDPYRLRDKPAAEAELSRLLSQVTTPLKALLGPCRLTLPWERTFEVQAHCPAPKG